MAGIQETRWFGRDVWLAADSYTFLHSGRPLPGRGETATRNEGLGVLLNGRATAAWRQGAEVWEVVSSRIVKARMKWVGCGQRKSSRESSDLTAVSVICAYARALYRREPQIFSKVQDTDWTRSLRTICPGVRRF